ncbi:E3 ubiquitin-protein ligase FANCL [Labeo rohita]|uniref:E3 ubiquitin-protein ligase FANCL n=1 Tax=Labeo rohita TaxID=84645 RepID=A0ABQ8M4K5_LABRO|nr:E3 ubiquitin-protein ligase FANCL [Labeo rohita]
MSCLLLRESPMIVALNKEKTVYDGFITVLVRKEKDLRIRIYLPPDHQMKQAKLHCCWQMKRLLHGYQHIVKQEVAMKSQPGCQSFSPPQYYSQLITEMETIGWDNLKSGTVADPDWFRKGEVPQNLVILMSFSCLEEATFTVNYCIDGVRLLFIDAEFRTLKLKAEDSAGRQHAVTVKLKSKVALMWCDCKIMLRDGAVRLWQGLKERRERVRGCGGTDKTMSDPHKYPTEAPEFSADLPVPLVITWTSQSTLANVHSQFLLNVEALSEFWSVLDEIDEQTWVLEPEKPTRADSMRRIAIGNNVSIKVQIDPRHPKMLPECCLLGAEHDRSATAGAAELTARNMFAAQCAFRFRVRWCRNGVKTVAVADPPSAGGKCPVLSAALLWHFFERIEIRVVTPLRNKLNANMHLWNPDCSVLQNMKDVLEIEFPSPATHEKSSFSVECGICYSYRLESAIPDQVCNDPRCGQPFHQVCLYEWLRGLPTSRQSFNIVFGECPYCSKPITVKMVTGNV